MNIAPFIANMAFQNTIRQAQTINMMNNFHNNSNNNKSHSEKPKETDKQKLERLKKKASYIPKHLSDEDLLIYLQEQEYERFKEFSI